MRNVLTRKESETKVPTKWAAGNWRFGASGGVAPRKVQWENERLCPA